MSANIIKCPSCGKHSNADLDFESCWGCGYIFKDSEKRTGAEPVGFHPVTTTPPPSVSATSLAGIGRPRSNHLDLSTVVGGVLVLALPVLFLVQCTSLTLSSKERELNEKTQALELASGFLASAEDSCFRQEVKKNQALGKKALGEWDEAAVANLAVISKEEEWEIRTSLGREMGLAPSEVNGWKDIYRSRAEAAATAKAAVAGEIRQADQEVKDVCGWRDEKRLEVRRLQDDVRRLQMAVNS